MEIWWIILIVIVVVGVLSAMLSIANNSGEKFFDLYKKMFQIPSQAHRTVIEFISDVNQQDLEGKIKIARTKTPGLNGYNSKKKLLILSDETLSSDSVGAFCIVAHELGHALQDHQGKMLKRMKALNVIGSIVGKIFLPAVLAAIILLFFENLTVYSIILGSVAGAIFLFACLMKILTILIEKDASKRALIMLDQFLPDPSMKDAKKFLSSARLTYWSDFMRLLFGWSGLTKKPKLFK